jgi:hypothetical protein
VKGALLSAATGQDRLVRLAALERPQPLRARVCVGTGSKDQQNLTGAPCSLEFPVKLVGVGAVHAAFSQKVAHVVVSRAAYRKFGSRQRSWAEKDGRNPSIVVTH